MTVMLTFRNPDNRFDITGNKKHFGFIVQDMLANGGDLVPSDHWNWNLGKENKNDNGYTDEVFVEKYNHLSDMLNPWVGITGMQALSEKSVQKYEKFLREIDHLQLLPPDILEHGNSNGWRETDLGSVLDINLIETFCIKNAQKKLSICEVGGGYGRLAEVFLETIKRDVHYVMVDAVPGSLMYAYYYLKSQFPELNIGSFYEGDDYDSHFDCYILPAWHMNVLQDASFDICVNIESLQEMQQHHVDYYLDIFDRLTISGGWIYLSNARDYVFKGKWNIPSNWETLYLNNTPRSWTADHPTHILRKNEGDYSRERCAHEIAFKQQVVSWSNDQLITELELHFADQDSITNALRKTINHMKSQQNDHKVKWKGLLNGLRSIFKSSID